MKADFEVIVLLLAAGWTGLRTAARVMDRTSNVRRLCRAGRNVGQSRLEFDEGQEKMSQRQR